MFSKPKYPVLLLFVLLSLVLSGYAVAADQSKLQVLDLRMYEQNQGLYTNKNVYLVGRVSADVKKGSSAFKIIASQGDRSASVDVLTKETITSDILGLDTVLVVGEVHSAGQKNRIQLKNAIWQRVCRLRGKLQDDVTPYSSAIFFNLPFGSVEKALSKGKQGLTELVTTGKILGISSADGSYDIHIPTGQQDIMIIYKDKVGKNDSMLWMISLDFGADTLNFNFGKASAVMKW